METRTEDNAVKKLNGHAETIISALRQIERTRRLLHVSKAQELGEALGELYRSMQRTVDQLLITDWPNECADEGEALLEAGSRIQTMLGDFRGAAKNSEKIWEQRVALGGISLVESMLYPHEAKLPAVRSYFVEEGAQLRAAAAPQATTGLRVLGPETGIQHMNSKDGERSPASMYVPEYYQDDQDWPLIIALHGASGVGSDYLFAWLRAAKSRGAIVLAPTSLGTTWSMLGPDADEVRISYLVEQAKSHYRIDENRILIAGMSDGGTYGWLLGSDKDIGCTHLAVLSATLHPQVAEPNRTKQLQGKDIYLLHGHLDELFPISSAADAVDALKGMGITVTYRDVPDLAHTTARDENAAIMDWFGCPLVPPIG